MPHALALLDTAALRALEAQATTSLGDEDVLMRRAGQAAWRCALTHWPQAQRIVVVCGPGNNGGDGYLLALHALQSGREVHVVRLAAHAPRTEPAQRACRAFEDAGGCVGLFTGTLPPADVIVDALFGIGLARAPDAPVAALIDAMNAAAAPVLAIDVPSGVDAERGNVAGAAVIANVTVQMLALHRGLFTGAALDHCGTRELASLDVNSDADQEPSAYALEPAMLGDWLRPRDRNSHKGANGHVLCIGGDHGSGGAIALCADAALRSGAGLVSVATRGLHVAAILGRRPEIMVRDADAADLAPSLSRTSVIAIGPGLGQQQWGRGLLDAVLAGGKPLVLDADALNLVARDNVTLPAGAILTPHPGEAARLLGIDAKAVQADRFAAAHAIATRFESIVVLKGAGTIVAAPDKRPRVIAAGNPGMAVGGMGDLLTGVVASLRAQGFSAFDAACCGALLHAAAGDVAARDGGERGLLPSDLLAPLRRLANPEPRA